jgi:hypothetical protein
MELSRSLHDRDLLELVLQVTITDSQDGVDEARILEYDFRTADHGKRNSELKVPSWHRANC